MKIIYGIHSITSYLEYDPKQIIALYCSSKQLNRRQQQIVNLATTQSISIYYIDESQLASKASSTHHQGVVAEINVKAQLSLEQFLNTATIHQKELILLLDGITDPQNLGTILRTAEYFALTTVILPKHNSANIDNATVSKAASGAINHLNVITVNNLNNAIKLLKKHDFWLAGTNLGDDSINLADFKFSGRLGLIMGNEHSGIRHLIAEHCDYLLKIPQYGKTQSLNVAVATGIVLAQLKSCPVPV